MKNGISALMDGELDAKDAASIIKGLRQSEDMRDEWATYHLIGDALRQSVTIPDITQRVSARLAAEPTVLAPWRRPPMHKVKTYASVAASLAVVAAVGWMGLQTIDRPAQENLAVAKPVSATAIQAPAVTAALAPAQMNGYLLAHQEFSPSTAIQGVAPYVRTVAVRTVADTQGRAAR